MTSNRFWSGRRRKLSQRTKRGKKRKYEKRKCNPPHHIIPSSRGGLSTEFNLIYPPLDLHVQYHILFENWTPKEIIEKLRAFWRGDDREILRHFNKPNKQKAYKILFGDMTHKEIEEDLEEIWFDSTASPYRVSKKDL